jgi:hypothetical protein
LPICDLDKNFFKSQIANRKSKIKLFILFMHRVAAAAATKLFKFQAFRRGFLIFRRHVVALLAFGALQRNIISRHNF